MARSPDMLLRRIDRMLKQIEPRLEPTQWELIAETGQELPAYILAQIGIYDTVIIREIPPGYLGDDIELPVVSWYKRGNRYFVPGQESTAA